MKALLISFITILFLFSFGFGQDQIVFNANSGSPVLKKEAGILKLKKVLTLDGDSELYQFKDPVRFDIGEDGSIFVMDWNRALYRFSPEGRFRSNLLKKGEGPGELKYFFRYFLEGDTVIQYCHHPNKVVRKKFIGEFLEEFSLPAKGSVLLLGVEKNLFFLTKHQSMNFLKDLTDKMKTFSYKNYFYRWWPGEKEIFKGETFYKELARFKRYPGGGITGSIAPDHAFELSNMKGGGVYFINGFHHRINRLDVNSLKITGQFGRPFEQIPYHYSREYINREKKEGNPIKKPEKKYFQAVQKLFNRKDELWIITSTYINNKGILVDVFSHDGIYKDKFYLPLFEITSPHLPEFNIVENKIIILSKDEDENHVVNVYEIQDM